MSFTLEKLGNIFTQLSKNDKATFEDDDNIILPLVKDVLNNLHIKYEVYDTVTKVFNIKKGLKFEEKNCIEIQLYWELNKWDEPQDN